MDYEFDYYSREGFRAYKRVMHRMSKDEARMHMEEFARANGGVGPLMADNVRQYGVHSIISIAMVVGLVVLVLKACS